MVKSKATPFINGEIWKELGRDTSRVKLPEKVAGLRAHLGLDLAACTEPITLVTWIPEASLAVADVWIADGQIKRMEERDHAPWGEWALRGDVRSVPGKVVPHEQIIADLAHHVRAFNVASLRLDEFRAPAIAVGLADRCGGGVASPATPPIQNLGVGYRDMSPALDRFQQLAQSGKFRHGNHPVLTMGVLATDVISRRHATGLDSKPRPRFSGAQGIGPAVALLMAIAPHLPGSSAAVPIEGERGGERPIPQI